MELTSFPFHFSYFIKELSELEICKKRIPKTVLRFEKRNFLASSFQEYFRKELAKL